MREVEQVVDQAGLKLDVAADHRQIFVQVGGRGRRALEAVTAIISTGVSGVRSSWLSTARKLSAVWLAASASRGFEQPLISLLRR
jgi:hypothetical protein